MTNDFPFQQQPIKGVSWANDQCCFRVGKNGVTLIEVQYVNGNGAPIPWFICWGTPHTSNSDTPVIAAINSSQVEYVSYQ